MVFFILLILFLLKTFQQFVKVCLRHFFNVFNSVETGKAAGLFVRSAVAFVQQPGHLAGGSFSASEAPTGLCPARRASGNAAADRPALATAA